jgi:hypothetical protein
MTTGKNINNEYSNDRKKYLTQNMISISISICKYILIQKDRDTYFNMEEYLYIHFLYSFKKVKGIQLNTTNFFCPHILKVDQFNTEGVLIYIMYIVCSLCGKKLQKVLMVKTYVGGEELIKEEKYEDQYESLYILTWKNMKIFCLPYILPFV